MTSNVSETLADVPVTCADGPAAYRQVGTEDAPGSMLFAVTGDVTTTGVYELPPGPPLRVLMEGIAGDRNEHEDLAKWAAQRTPVRLSDRTAQREPRGPSTRSRSRRPYRNPIQRADAQWGARRRG